MTAGAEAVVVAQPSALTRSITDLTEYVTPDAMAARGGILKTPPRTSWRFIAARQGASVG